MCSALGMCLIFSVLMIMPGMLSGQSTVSDPTAPKLDTVIAITPLSTMSLLTIQHATPTLPNVYLPPYTQGVFCNFEDKLNTKTPIRIDLSVK